MWGSIITVTLLEIVIIGCVGNMRNEKFGYIWAILMEGRLVGWCLCVFTSDVKSLFVGSSRVPLRSIQALVPRYASEDFSDPFISPREQGAFVFPSRKCNIGTYVDVGGTLSRLSKVILL